ncbi:MAG: hypothetical protein B7Y39_14060 [Bdellovibrio sp. 28-41-41]|nr:MAG: hypothetical protein B7Y39_14060 [Bdellovibrio sp. 28-41-41]
MKIKFLILFPFLCGTLNAALNADEILRKSEKYRSLDGNYSVSVVVINQMANLIQDESRFSVKIKDNTTSLVEQVYPASSRGKKLLMINNDLWMKTNDIKKGIRINLDQKLTGETANGDLAKTNFYIDYQPKIIEENSSFYKLHLKSKHDQTTYSQINYYVFKEGLIPFKAEFMAVSGKILKIAEYAKPTKKIKDRILISKLKISDAVVKQRSSILKYENFKVHKIDDAVFNRASM